MNDIQKKMSQAALYDILAEEATELAHAALKMSRKLRNESPTPMSISEITAYVIEEFTDVTLCAKILDLSPDEGLMAFKQNRWTERLNSSQKIHTL